MVVVAPAEHARVDVGAGGNGERFEDVRDQRHRQASHRGTGPVDISDGIGPAGEIDSHEGQCFVHWHVRRPDPYDAGSFVQRPVKGPPQRQGDILHRVMRIHVQVTLGLHRQIEQE